MSDAYLVEIKVNTDNPKDVLSELLNWHPALNQFTSKYDDDGTLRLWGFFGLDQAETPARMHQRLTGFMHKFDPALKVTTRWRWVQWEHEFTTRGKPEKSTRHVSGIHA